MNDSDFQKAWAELRGLVRFEFEKLIDHNRFQAGLLIALTVLVIMIGIELAATWKAVFAPCSCSAWDGNGILQQVALFRELMGG